MTSSIIYAIQSLLVATRSLGNEYGHMVFIILLENGKRDTMVTCPSLFNFIIKNNETFFYIAGCGLSEWQSSVEFNNAIGRSYDADPASIVHCQ